MWKETGKRWRLRYRVILQGLSFFSVLQVDPRNTLRKLFERIGGEVLNLLILLVDVFGCQRVIWEPESSDS